MANASQPPGRTPLSLARPIAASLGTVPAIDAPGRDVPDARESCPRRRAFQVLRRNRLYPANIAVLSRASQAVASAKPGTISTSCSTPETCLRFVLHGA